MKYRQTSACPQWAPLLAALHPDDLAPDEQRQLELHLAVCPACREAYAAHLVMAARIGRLPSARPLETLPPALIREWGELRRVPLRAVALSEEAAEERPGSLVPLRSRRAVHAAGEDDVAGPVLTLIAPGDDGDESAEHLSGVAGEPDLTETYWELNHLAEREVAGLVGLPERLPHALAALPPVFSFARPARSTSQWQALVACFVMVPLLLLIMPLGALQRLGQGTAGRTLDSYIQPSSFSQKCTGLLGLPEVTVALDNTQNTQPLDWRVSIQDTDPSGSLPWARASETSGTVPAGARASFTLTPLGVLCEIMQGAPAPIEYHVIFFSQGQRTTITDSVTPS